jgi:predicted MFS family arabinose efflux permease
MSAPQPPLDISRKATPREWLAIAPVALGTFALVTSEFLPVGLLTSVASEMQASEGITGLMMTIPGLVAAVAAPAVMLVAGKLDRRIILWVLSAILVLSNLIVALAPNLPMILLGRVLLGIDIGAFWAISSVVATRIVPAASVGRANSIIFSGISVGAVLGVPAGALIGHAFGWRASFGVVAGFGAFVLAAQLWLLPRLAPTEIVSMRHLVALFRIPQARIGLIAIFVSFAGHFGAYTFMGAFLEHVTHATPALLSSVLLGYGIASFTGNLVAGAAAQRDARMTLGLTALGLGVAMVLLTIFGSAEVPAAVLIILWGFAFGALPIATQGWMLKAAPQEMESASAMYIAVLQLGLASGAFLGGFAVDRIGLIATLVSAGVVCLGTAAMVWLFGRDDQASVTSHAMMARRTGAVRD